MVALHFMRSVTYVQYVHFIVRTPLIIINFHNALISIVALKNLLLLLYIDL